MQHVEECLLSRIFVSASVNAQHRVHVLGVVVPASSSKARSSVVVVPVVAYTVHVGHLGI